MSRPKDFEYIEDNMYECGFCLNENKVTIDLSDGQKTYRPCSNCVFPHIIIALRKIADKK